MPKARSPSVELIATVADAHRSKIHEVADALKAAGLDVSHTLETSGIIAGSASQDAMERLRKVRGVVSIEQSGGAQIAPPDSDVQ